MGLKQRSTDITFKLCLCSQSWMDFICLCHEAPLLFKDIQKNTNVQYSCLVHHATFRKGTAAINNNQSTKDIVEKSPQQIEILLLFEYHLFGAALSYCFCFLKNLSIWIQASLAPILELPKHCLLLD